MNKKNQNQDEGINIEVDKNILIDTSSKKKVKSEKNKTDKEGLGRKKKRRAEDDLEEMMDDEKFLSKKFEDKMDISDKSSDEEYIDDDSDSEEEVLVDENHDDKSEDYENEDNEEMNDEETKKNVKVNIWDEKEGLKENEQLEYANEAYEMLHRANIEWPCMTVDFIIPENFYPPIKNFYEKKENIKDDFPYECYMVAGSQTNTENGFLYYMKWSNMHKTKYDDDPDKGADSDDEEGQEPIMRFEKVQAKGNINRIKTMRNSYLTAYWSDAGSVEIVDMRTLISEMEEAYDKNNKKNKENNLGKNKKRKLGSKDITLKSFSRQQEGFGIEWGWLTPGVLAAGGLDKKIEIYIPTDESCTNWVLNSNNAGNSFGILKGHKNSVEDIIWSPNQPHVLASCSVDRSIRFWDLRVDKNNPAIVLEKAHESDVNCISWNYHCDFMIASGGDDAAFKVWDIRYIKDGPISDIQWHKGPITAISWDPYEDSQLAVSSEDNRLSVWDFSVEPDDVVLFDENHKPVPHQLVFLHQGQENIKDIKFHPYYQSILVSTAENGINLLKPAFTAEDDSVASDEEEMQVD